MTDPPSACPHCGAAIGPDVLVCPSCHTPIDPVPATVLDPAPPGAPAPVEEAPAEPGAEAPPVVPASTLRGGRGLPRRAVPSAPNPFAGELARRLTRIAQWAEGAGPLGVSIPRLPAWAEDAARSSANPEPWAEAVRGIERIAQKRIVTAFEEWEKRTKARLARLEAYAVDSRLEREQIEETLHAARTGDVAQAIATFQQVDRVVTLKERHLDQARDELERVVALLRDMQALGVEPPQDPAFSADDLEGELRAGKLAPLKQQIRQLRLQAVNRLKAGLPRYIADYGDFLLEERAHGIATELEASELARGAREFFRGHPEEGLRRLRALQQTHGAPPGRSPRSTLARR
ncbi:MAG TPA: zinc ribbon domain-containing protein [Thermoplasmata archaeon]|nr:zinc ribbon domain-containing protein [Thermoplasmata archaeon]